MTYMSPFLYFCLYLDAVFTDANEIKRGLQNPFDIILGETPDDKDKNIFDAVLGITEEENSCESITEFASDIQKLVDGINYITDSPICIGLPSKGLVDVGFYLYATAVCEYVDGISAILEAVSGPIAENQ